MRSRYSFLCLSLIFISHFVSIEAIQPTLTVEIPMRDGAKLPADVYLPTPDARGLPCVLIRTPNGRASHVDEYASLAQDGYAVVIEDMRSTLSTDGKAMPFVTDAWGALQDGYDTVQWLAKAPFSNGKVGTAGISARGIAQQLLAPSNPPALVSQHIGFASASLYTGLYTGGQLQKSTVEGWLGLYAKDPSVLKFVTDRPLYDKFWAQFDSLAVANRVHVPALHFGGWYDLFLKGTLGSFEARQERGGIGARGKQKLVIGPWTHFWPQSQKLGDFDVPANAQQPPADISLKRWADYTLKGIDNGMDKLPAVTYYVMGPLDGTPSSGNVWRTSDRWPVPAKETPYYLTADGALSSAKPCKRTDRGFDHASSNPVPTLGGHNLFLEAGPKDQRPIEGRPDVLVFTSEPLAEDLEVTGPLVAKIVFSTDQPDADVVVRLTDVYPDGRSILVSDGIQRLGHGNSAVPDVRHEVSVDLWATSQVFAKGHRIRVSVTSSNYPKFACTLNCYEAGTEDTAGPVAHNTVYFGGEMASRVLLPLVTR